MAKIEVLLRKDTQSLGYIRLDEKGKPFYSYPYSQATEMTVEQAIKVVDKLSHTYLFKIHRTEQEKKSEIKAHYILC